MPKKPLIDQFSDKQFIEIVRSSESYTEIATKIGYTNYNHAILGPIQKRIESLNIDTLHFKFRHSGKLDDEDVFVDQRQYEPPYIAQTTVRNHYKKRPEVEYICSICGQPPIWMNQRLTLILDHINGCNIDNRLINLRWVCPNCNQQLGTTCRTTNARQYSKQGPKSKTKICIDCGTPICRTSTRCRKCSDIERSKKSSSPSNSISRDELKALIRTTPFVKIAKQYNVSDVAVHKWCKKFNLPSRTRDIKSLSDEEWEQI